MPEMQSIRITPIRTCAKDRQTEITLKFEQFTNSLEGRGQFTLASLKSTKNGSSVSAEDDLHDIRSDISLLRCEVEKYNGPETPLSKTIYEAGLKLKMKLDRPEFDDEKFRFSRRKELAEIDEILDLLAGKIH